MNKRKERIYASFEKLVARNGNALKRLAESDAETRRLTIKVGDKVRLSSDGSGMLVTATERTIEILTYQLAEGNVTKEESK